MKQNHIIIGLLCGILGVFCLTGCDKADGIGDWTFEYPAPIFENTELGQLRKELYETYKVNFTPEFDDKFYEFDWNNEFDLFETQTIPEADQSYTISYLKEVKAVLQQMPTFLIERLPSHVILVDSLRNPYNIRYNYQTVSESVHGIMGYNITNFLVFSYAGKSFPLQDKNELRETWTELFFERALSDYEAPEAFKELVAKQSAGSTKGYSLTGVWRTYQTMTSYGFLEDSYLRRNKINYGDIDNKGKIISLIYHLQMTEIQDLALFIGFTMYRPQAGKEEMYALSDVFAQKEELVKKFCSNTLGFELKPIVNK